MAVLPLFLNCTLVDRDSVRVRSGGRRENGDQGGFLQESSLICSAVYAKIFLADGGISVCGKDADGPVVVPDPQHHEGLVLLPGGKGVNVVDVYLVVAENIDDFGQSS